MAWTCDECQGLSSRPTLVSLIISDFRASRNGLASVGFWAAAIYRVGHTRFRSSSILWQLFWSIVAVVPRIFSTVILGIEIGPTAHLGPYFRIEHNGCVVVHGCVIAGSHLTLRQGVTLGNRSPARPREAPVLGRNVSVGAGAKILGGVEIGDDCLIGANCVVLDSFESCSTVVGIPGRRVEGLNDGGVGGPSD